MEKIQELLQKRVVLLDGAMGTELQKHGMRSGVCPELWCLENPKVLQTIHDAYVRAGSDVLYTCTFGANRCKLDHFSRKDVKAVNRNLALLARKSANGRCLVAGDIGPTGRFVEPFGDFPFEEAVLVFREQIEGLLAGGVDLLVIETMIDIQEARAALLAAQELTKKFTCVTMTYEKNGRTLNGTTMLSALITLQSLGAHAVGCNCSTGPEDMLVCMQQAQPYSLVPLIAKPNADIPHLINGQAVFTMNKQDFAHQAVHIVQSGARMIGGCCGTTPGHIAALKEHLEGVRPVKNKRISLSALSSSREGFLFKNTPEIILIGERINPTGKKAFQAELRNSSTNYIRTQAYAQREKGAHLLDVNVGAAGISEEKSLISAVRLLSVISPLPLVLDTTNFEALEQALRIYPGRALINSISGEKSKLNRFLSLARRYGAMFILLPVAGKKIPETFNQRKDVIEKVLEVARKHGFTTDDIFIDALALSVASCADAASEALETIEWCTQKLKAHTVIGLSNISFGLPGRAWVNSSFLSMAVQKGLSAVIADPLSEELVCTKKAAELLLGRDTHAQRYVVHFKKDGTKHIQSGKTSSHDQIFSAICQGNKEEILKFVKQALAEGISAIALVNTVVIPAITNVGHLFDRKEYFLPQLIASAEVVKKALEHLNPLLRREHAGNAYKAVVILATVEGDIHDIGKNLVSLMLKNHGFEVVDLGKDVSTGTIIKAIKQHKPKVVGLSALMTTTMVKMDEVIQAARKEGIDCFFVVGGAVVTQRYAQSIGAEYAKDCVEAVRVVDGLVA